VYCLYLRLCSLNDKSIAGRCPVSIVITRNRTPLRHVCYGLYLYFSALSLGRASERLYYFFKRSHVSVWNWMQKYKPQRISYSRRKITGYIVDETLIKAGSEHIWLWVAIEPKDKEILALTIQRKKHVCCGAIYSRFGSNLWRALSINRWRNLVPTGVQVSRNKTPYPFSI
jgi:hypothetical protein